MNDTHDNPTRYGPSEPHDQPAPFESLDDEALAEAFLDRDWTLAQVRDAAAMWRRSCNSSALHDRLRDYDTLRRAIQDGAASLPNTDTDTAEPNGGVGISGGAGGAGDSGGEAFCQRLTEAVGVASGQLTREASGSRADAPLAAGGGGSARSVRPWRRAPALAAAVALGALLGAASFWLGDASPEPDASRRADNSKDTPQAFVAHDTLSDDEAAQYSEAFREVAASLDGRAGWMQLSDEVGEVGTVSRAMAAPDRVLVLRLAVWREGERVARCDVVSRPNQSARLTGRLARASRASGAPLRVRYAISLGADGDAPVSLWAGIEHVEPTASETSAVTDARLLASLATSRTLTVGAPVTIGALNTERGRFHITASLTHVGAPQPPNEGAL